MSLHDDDRLEPELLKDLPVSTEGPSERTRLAIREAVMDDLEPLPARSVSTRAAWVLGIALLSATAVVLSYGLPGLTNASLHGHGALACGSVAVLSALAIALSFAPGMQQRLSSPRRGLALAVLVAAWSAFVLGDTQGGLLSGVNLHVWGCTLRSLVAGVVAGAALMWIWRKTDPWTPRISGALIGAAAGCVASAGVGAACVAQHTGHILIGHWVAVPVLALVGWLVARRTLAP